MSRSVLLLACFAVVTSSDAFAQEPLKKSPAELAATIDRLIEAKLKDLGVPLAPPADDAEFLRRVSVDVVGHIPRVSEIRRFLENTNADKRTAELETLLASNAHLVAMGSYWRHALIPDNNNNQFFQFQFPDLKVWLEQKVRENAPYDKMVHEVIAGAIQNPQIGAVNIRAIGGTSNVAAQAFYAANEGKPENAASSVTRQFLGVRLECAQCHNHPFAAWKKQQFWETAAFFAQLQNGGRRININVKAPPATNAILREIKIPNSKDVAKAKFIDGTEPEWKDSDDSRKVLADWIVSPNNPYFARQAVNRLWAHFFGYGLADPVDDETTEENPVSHPELLAELTRQFVANGHDIKYLIRAFVSTKTYERTSAQSDPSQSDARLWARMPIRGLTGEQMYDSLAIALGHRSTGNDPRGFGGPRFEFVNRFGGKERPSERPTSILQALMLMNGNMVNDGASLARGNTLAAVADAPFMSTNEKIETLFLATLSRMPRADEAERYGSYVARGGVGNDPRAALADVFWILINSAEFSVNR